MAEHIDGYWCGNLKCAKCYGADTWQTSAAHRLQEENWLLHKAQLELEADATKLREQRDEAKASAAEFERIYLQAFNVAQDHLNELAKARSTVDELRSQVEHDKLANGLQWQEVGRQLLKIVEFAKKHSGFGYSCGEQIKAVIARYNMAPGVQPDAMETPTATSSAVNMTEPPGTGGF